MVNVEVTQECQNTIIRNDSHQNLVFAGKKVLVIWEDHASRFHLHPLNPLSYVHYVRHLLHFHSFLILEFWWLRQTQRNATLKISVIQTVGLKIVWWWMIESNFLFVSQNCIKKIYLVFPKFFFSHAPDSAHKNLARNLKDFKKLLT